MTDATDENARLKARVKRLEAALRDIGRMRYGPELNDTAEELFRYWSRLALDYRVTANRALEGEP